MFLHKRKQYHIHEKDKEDIPVPNWVENNKQFSSCLFLEAETTHKNY